MRVAFVFTFLASFVALAAVSPFFGVLGYAILDYMGPERVSWGFVRGLPWSMMIASATVVFWLLREKKTFPKLDLLLAFLLIYYLWINITTIFAIAPSEAVHFKWDRTIKTIGFAIFSMALVTNRVRIEAFIWVFLACIGFFVINGAFITLLGGGGGYKVTGAQSGFLAPRSHLAVAIWMAIPLIVFVYRRGTLLPQIPLVKAGLIALIACCVIALIGSYSRTGLVTAIPVLGVFFMRSRQRLKVAGTALVALILLAVFAPPEWVERMSTITTYDQDNSAMSRIDSWMFGLQVALDNPIFGGGFRVFVYNIGEDGAWTNAHNIYFEVLAEHGFIGLFLFLGILGLGYLKTRRIVKAYRDHPTLSWYSDLASMLGVSLVAFAVGGSFVNIAHHAILYDFIMLIIVTDMVARQAAARAQDSVAASDTTTSALAGASGRKGFQPRWRNAPPQGIGAMRSGRSS